MVRDISGVILAGGENKRFGGRFKPEIIIGGKTIFDRIINIIGEIFEEIIIVTDKPEKFIHTSGYKIITDIFKKAGPLGGIHAAMLSSTRDAVFVFGGDMPFLQKSLIIDQINEFVLRKCDALVPFTNNYPEPLHAIYSNHLIDKLESYMAGDPSHAVKDFIATIDSYHFDVPDINDQKAFKNINSLSDMTDI